MHALVLIRIRIPIRILKVTVVRAEQMSAEPLAA
jgi:hypothetical protein